MYFLSVKDENILNRGRRGTSTLIKRYTLYCVHSSYSKKPIIHHTNTYEDPAKILDLSTQGSEVQVIDLLKKKSFVLVTHQGVRVSRYSIFFFFCDFALIFIRLYFYNIYVCVC